LKKSFWLIHGLLPLSASCVVLSVIVLEDVDTKLASLFYDTDGARWIGAHTWWASTVLHDGGRWLIRLVALGALLTWLTTFRSERSSDLHRQAAYVALTIILATALVGALKTVTNVDCPWDLIPFGGDRPLIHWFEHKPGDLPHAACFPGAHSSSGFSLVCLYFVLRQRRPALRWLGLLAGLGVGAIFSFAQQARGAHFLSHDLWSAIICWYVALLLAVILLKQPRRTVSRTSTGTASLCPVPASHPLRTSRQCAEPVPRRHP
jgi:membrane-associated PAP2 superfamily phosphatase